MTELDSGHVIIIGLCFNISFLIVIISDTKDKFLHTQPTFLKLSLLSLFSVAQWLENVFLLTERGQETQTFTGTDKTVDFNTSESQRVNI